MNPVMRSAARVRGLPGLVAGLALAIPSAGYTLSVTAASVSPAAIVPLGTVVTITATLVNDTGNLGSLCAETQMSTLGCGYCVGTDGLYAMYADDPQILTGPAAVTPTLEFSRNPTETAVVVWQFTATRTGTVGLSLIAHDTVLEVSEGCGDPSPAGVCGTYFGFLADPLTCGFVSLTVTSTLAGRVDAMVIAPTPRPANTAYPGDTIAVAMSLTNTGGTPLALNAGVSATRAGSTARMLPAAAPAFPVGLTAGSSTVLTWTWSVTADTPTPSTVTFGGDVERTYAVSNALTISAAPLQIGVTLLIDPDGGATAWAAVAAVASWPVINDEIRVVATVTNTGGTPLDVDPAIVPPDAYANAIPDLMETAPRTPAGAQVIAAGSSVTFTWTYRIDRNDVYQTCFFSAPPTMDFRVRARGIERLNALEVRNDAVTLAGAGPASVTVGMPFAATLWITNTTGRAIELDASATVFLVSDDGAKAAVTGGPAPAGSRVFAPGESLPYVFTLDALALGSAPLRGGILFPGGHLTGAPCQGSPQFSVEVVAPSPLDAVLVSSTTLVNVGTAYELTLTISNSSTCSAELDSDGDLANLVPSREFPYNGSFISQLSSDCGSFPCAVPASGSVTVRFTVTPNECGDVNWAGTETGRWAGCGNTPFSRPFNSPVIHIRRPAVLAEDASVTWTLPKTQVVQGQLFNVIATVIPAGENDLVNFTLTIAGSGSAGTLVTSMVAPSPPAVFAGCGACVTNICPAKAQSFTWTFRADAKGTASGFYRFTITATGADPFNGQSSFSVTTTGQIQILRPSVLMMNGVVPGEGTVYVDTSGSSGILFGCQVPVVACFEVDGDTSISTTTFLPGAGMTPAPAGRVVLSGSPAIPALLSPGEHCFTWTFSPVGAGTVDFTASGVGTEVTYGTTSYTQASTFGGAEILPAALTAMVAVSASVITTADGSYVNVDLAVANAGHVGIANLGLSVTVTGAACGARPVRDPVLASTTFADLVTPVAGCGDDRFFRWTFTPTATSAGVMVFSITVTAQDAQTSAPLTVTAFTVCVTVIPRPPVQITLIAGSATIVQGADLGVTVRLANTGGTPVNVHPGVQILAANTPDLVPVPAPPPGTTLVPAYSVTDVVARISAKATAALGPVQITLTPTAFTATDADAGIPGTPAVAVTLSGSLVVTVVAPVGPVEPGVTIGENPWRPLLGPLRLTWGEPAGGAVTLRVLSITGETVRTLLTGTAPGTTGVILWDGTNESGQTLAAGVYLLRWESAGKKQTRKLAVVK